MYFRMARLCTICLTLKSRITKHCISPAIIILITTVGKELEKLTRIKGRSFHDNQGWISDTKVDGPTFVPKGG